MWTYLKKRKNYGFIIFKVKILYICEANCK